MYRILLMVAVLIACREPLMASSLKKQISKDQDLTAVIVPDDKKAHNGYEILILPQDEFRRRTAMISDTNLENNYFKLVHNEDDNSPALIGEFDGDNVLYHLMVARDYYQKLSAASGHDNEALNHKVIVRLGVTKAYNTASHFAELSRYNDARNIPLNYDKKWDDEIWFHSRKGQLENVNWKMMIAASGASAALGGAILLPITVPIDLYDHYNHGMDSAKMPNAIYHEAFHWATNTPDLFLLRSEADPVSENYANYFGSSLSGRPQLLEIKEFTSVFYKRNYEKVKPVKNTKSSMYNYTSFVPALFWQIRDILGPDRADQIIWNSLYEFNGPPRHAQIPRAFIRAARRDPTVTDTELSQISALFDKYYKSFVNLDTRFNLRALPETPTLQPSLGTE